MKHKMEKNLLPIRKNLLHHPNACHFQNHQFYIFWPHSPSKHPKVATTKKSDFRRHPITTWHKEQTYLHSTQSLILTRDQLKQLFWNSWTSKIKHKKNQKSISTDEGWHSNDQGCWEKPVGKEAKGKSVVVMRCIRSLISGSFWLFISSCHQYAKLYFLLA